MTSTAEAVRKLNTRKDVLVKDVHAINAIGQTMMTYSQSLAGYPAARYPGAGSYPGAGPYPGAGSYPGAGCPGAGSYPEAGYRASPRQAERFFENLLSRSRAMTSARADLEEEILQLSRQIDALSSAEKKKEGKTNGEVSVVIMTKQPTDIELRLTYRKSSSISSVDFPEYAALPQLFEVQYGLLPTNYTPPRMQAYLHHRYLCITVRASRKAQAKIGQTSSSH